MYRKLLFCKLLVVLLVSGLFMAAGGFISSPPAMGEGKAAATAGDAGVPEIEHPMMKPKMYSAVMRCPNCGMMINMYARTRHAFHHPEGDFTTCSIRCMADKANSSGAEPSNIQAAVYLDPDRMIPAPDAVYVIGSSAPGTMTMQSKIAFADKPSAEQFAAKYGGRVADFQEAYAAAKSELPESRMQIDQKRKKTGKIKEPAAQDACAVCGMYPARFPQHNSQILAMNDSTLHFCSTRCLVTFTAAPAKYMKDPPKTKMAWIKLYPDGMYESAYGAYYVVGSRVDGPMGKEAIPFKLKRDAETFVSENGGDIVGFEQLTPELIAGEK